MKIEFVLNEQPDRKRSVNNDPKGRQEDFELKLKRIYEQNKHKYKYMFIRFTNNPERQTGINPRYSYHTPLGIYAYPFNLKTIDKIINKDQDFTFGNDMSSIVIFGWNQSNTKGKTIHIGPINFNRLSSQYTDISLEEYQQYFKLLEKYCLNNFKWFIYRVLYKYLDSGMTFLTFIHKSTSFDYLSKKLKQAPMDDQEDVLINELTDINDKLELIQTYLNIRAGEAKNTRYFTKIFNITRNLAKDSNEWSGLMRKVLNISTIIDDGSSLIHSAEPFQAVFLEPHKTSLIAVLDNQLFKTKNKREPVLDPHLREWLQSNNFSNFQINEDNATWSGRLRYVIFNQSSFGMYDSDGNGLYFTLYLGIDSRIITNISKAFQDMTNEDNKNYIKTIIENISKDISKLISDVQHISTFFTKDYAKGLVIETPGSSSPIKDEVFKILRNKIVKQFKQIGFTIS